MVTTAKFTEGGCPVFEGLLQPMHLVVICRNSCWFSGPRDCLSWAKASAMAYVDLGGQREISLSLAMSNSRNSEVCYSHGGPGLGRCVLVSVLNANREG